MHEGWQAAGSFDRPFKAEHHS
ncbi:MAG: hypothetical protein JWM98_808, partial [Thermoleophilia bacterium]|nr:hypothetical protein [Thermoleophilia bacterium]